ncbi:hypothetical protein BJY04DRAFT_186762 [Aspergillus karnatakaensis]|uniref:RNA recognition motif domain-containing protein n=1 Tax=Aspergillus karnatakaensis TaxID=1810916 RepID=UPI003CCDB3F2
MSQVHISNLPPKTTFEDLEIAFSQNGLRPTKVTVNIQRREGTITFDKEGEAAEAFYKLSLNEHSAFLP